jgi:hypothetical protein
MAVSTSNVSSGPFIANGVTTAFPFNFAAASTDEIEVVATVGGAESIVPADNYTVSLSVAGGTVTFGTAPAAGLITIRSEPSFSQQIVIENGGFVPEVLNEGLDRSLLRDLWLRARLLLSAVLPPTAEGRAALVGKFPVVAGDGSFGWSAGTGADAGLRTDLASDEGVALVGGAAKKDLSGLSAVNTTLTKDSLTYPVGNERETYTQFSLTASDARAGKREFIFSYCANFSRETVTGDPDTEGKVLHYWGASMDGATKKAWAGNMLVVIKPTVTDVQYVNVCEFDIDNFKADYGAGIGAAGLPLPSVYGVTANASGTHTITAAFGVISSAAAPCYERGYVVGLGGVKQASFDDYASGTCSYRDTGSHTIGVDLSGAYTAAALRVGNGSSFGIIGKTSGGANAPMMAIDDSNNVLIGGSGITNIVVQNTILPATDNTLQLGASGNRFASVWAANGTIQTSDETLKTSIAAIDPAKASIFLDVLAPSNYKWVVGGRRPIMGTEPQQVEVRREIVIVASPNGTEHEIESPVYETRDVPVVIGWEDVPGQRTHYGFIASNVKAAVDAAGFEDFGGYVLGEDGTEALRPDQILALACVEIKSLRLRVAALEAA